MSASRNGTAEACWCAGKSCRKSRSPRLCVCARHKPLAGGFTLIELLLVLLLIALLASLAAPVVIGSVQRAKESALKEDLFVLRKAIDDYYADHGHYPESLEKLVEKRYIRRLPADPFTGSKDTWVLVRVEGTEGGSGGIIDVRSGSEEKAADGSWYKDW